MFIRKASIDFSYIFIFFSIFRYSYVGAQFSMEERKVGERYVGLDAASFSTSFKIACSWDLQNLVKLTK